MNTGAPGPRGDRCPIHRAAVTGLYRERDDGGEIARQTRNSADYCCCSVDLWPPVSEDVRIAALRKSKQREDGGRRERNRERAKDKDPLKCEVSLET